MRPIWASLSDLLYHAARGLGAPFRYRMVIKTPLPLRSPALFVGNHASAHGPIQSILTLPARVHPWVVHQMTRLHTAPGYLYEDFISRVWKLRGPLGRIASGLIGPIAVTLIVGLGSVPVDRSNGLFDRSIRRSLQLLLAGRNLVIFPGDPRRAASQEDPIRPFGAGFAWLAYRYQLESGRSLPIYPLAFCPPRRTLAVGPPLHLLPEADRRTAIRVACQQTEGVVRHLYAELCATEGG